MRFTASLAVLSLAAGSALSADILLGGDQGLVQVLDTETGTTTFLGTCSGPVNSMAVLGDELYLGDHNGTVYAFDMNTNSVTNAFSVPGDASAMIVLGEDLLVGDTSDALHRVDPQTGLVTETLGPFGTDVQAIGADAGGLFLGGHSSFALRAHIGTQSFGFFAACGSSINSMAFGPRTMFLGGITLSGNGGTVYMFDKFVGGVNYTGTHAVPSDMTAMVYADGTLFIGGSDGFVHAMDPSTGEITKSYDTGSAIQAMTPIDGGVSCPADYDISGQLDFFDLAQFLDLFNQQLPAADTNGDGQHDFFDLEAFLSVFETGCP